MILRDRQKEIFVQRYTAGLCANEKQAAIDAGIDADRAQRVADGWLKEPIVNQRVDELLRPFIREQDITRARIIEQYARIAFADPRACFDDDGCLKNLTELPYDVIAALAEFKNTANGPSIKFESKKAALDKLAEIARVIAPEGEDGKGVTVQIIQFGAESTPSDFD